MSTKSEVFDTFESITIRVINMGEIHVKADEFEIPEWVEERSSYYRIFLTMSYFARENGIQIDSNEFEKTDSIYDLIYHFHDCNLTISCVREVHMHLIQDDKAWIELNEEKLNRIMQNEKNGSKRRGVRAAKNLNLF